MNNIIAIVFYATLSMLSYVDDSVQFPWQRDHWQSYANEVEQHQSFLGDCDDMALTTIELLDRKGFPRNQMFICTCETEQGDKHLVGVVDGKLMDSRMRQLWNWYEVGYKYESCMSMSEVGTWRLVK